MEIGNLKRRFLSRKVERNGAHSIEGRWDVESVLIIFRQLFMLSLRKSGPKHLVVRRNQMAAEIHLGVVEVLGIEISWDVRVWLVSTHKNIIDS